MSAARESRRRVLLLKMAAKYVWSQRASLRLIRLYKENTLLWNQYHQHYYNKAQKEIAWANIAEKMGIEVDKCKNKMHTMLAALRREKVRIKKGNCIYIRGH